MSDFKGSGPGGFVMPDDLRLSFEEEAERIGGNGAAPADQEKEAATPATKLDVRRFDQLVDRLMRAMKLWLDQSDQQRDAKFDALQAFFLRSVGASGREQVAAAWSGPAEGMLRLARAVARFGELEEGKEFERANAAEVVEELRHVCAELERATVAEEGKVSAIDEALGSDGTLGERIEAVRAKVAAMQESLQGFVDGDEAPDERKVVGVLGGALVDLARIFGARGDGKAPPLKRASIDGDRGGPREPRETKEARAFRADFEVAMSGLRSHLRWQEWTVRVLLVGAGAGIGWAAGLAV